MFVNTPTNNPAWMADGESFSYSGMPDIEACFYTAVGTILSITQIKSLVASIQAGAARATVINSLKLMGRRVAFAVTVVVAVYQLGDCLEWW